MQPNVLHSPTFKILRLNYIHLKLCSLLALLFSLLYVFFPWTEVKIGVEGSDIPVYLMRIELLLTDSDAPLDESSVLRFWSQEPIWRSILIFIGDYFDEPINGLLFVSFFCIFTYSFFLFGRINIFVASFILLNPLVIDLVIFQVRSALALALCLSALMLKGRWLGLILIVMASLIHTATFIILTVYIYAKFLENNQNRFDHKLLRFSALFLSLVLAVLLGDLRETILGSIGDRRAEYEVETNSFLYLGYWLLLAFALLITRNRKNFKDYWGDYYSIVMLALPFLLALFSTNGLRFIPLTLLIVLPTIFRREKPHRLLLLGSLFCYQIVQYTYWLKTI